MKVLHQHGHNFVWNLDSYEKDGAGDGHIVSPVNIDPDGISSRMSEIVRKRSILDPQFYLPDDPKGCLERYSFFPGNVLDQFETIEFEENAYRVARECLAFQQHMGFQYAVIPTRYFQDHPTNALEQMTALFVEPFVSEHASLGDSPPLLLTVIVKPIHFEDQLLRTELLSWITNYPSLRGVYVIFDNDFYTKQIKDAAYLAAQLLFIHDLRLNGLEVHVGYTNTEAILLSAADPTSVSMGSFENLRSFGIRRLETREPEIRRGPSPRIYSGRLLQWIDDTVVPALRTLVPNWTDLFEDSTYKADILAEGEKERYRPKIYKHYFTTFYQQVAGLPEAADDRPAYIRELVIEALDLFEAIRSRGVFLDSDSDGSHLSAWMNALSIYEKSRET